MWRDGLRFWVRLGHDACVLAARPPQTDSIRYFNTLRIERRPRLQATQGETLTFLSVARKRCDYGITTGVSSVETSAPRPCVDFTFNYVMACDFITYNENITHHLHSSCTRPDGDWCDEPKHFTCDVTVTSRLREMALSDAD